MINTLKSINTLKLLKLWTNTIYPLTRVTYVKHAPDLLEQPSRDRYQPVGGAGQRLSVGRFPSRVIQLIMYWSLFLSRYRAKY